MADQDDEDVVVTLGEEAAAGAGADPVKDLASQFGELKARAEREEQARRDADRRAEEARQAAARAQQEANEAKAQVADREADTIATGLSAAQTELAAAKAEYRAAMEAGDFAKAADAQERISTAAAEKVRLEEAKADVAARKAQPAGRRPADEPARAADPVEAFIASKTPAAAEWLRAHRDWVTDPKKSARLTAAHWDAVAESIAVDTPEYFEFVETKIGLRKSDADSNGNGAAKPAAQRRSSAAPVAPVTAASGSVNGNGATVRLTKGEALAATDGTIVWNYDDPTGNGRFRKGDPIGVQEMARRKSAMEKKGLYDRSFVEQ